MSSVLGLQGCSGYQDYPGKLVGCLPALNHGFSLIPPNRQGMTGLESSDVCPSSMFVHGPLVTKGAHNMRRFIAHAPYRNIGKVTGAMELILEQEEVEELLLEALKVRGISLPDGVKMVIRQNHKRKSVRVVFQDRPDPRGRKRVEV